jgi:hypothetical protein
MTTLGFVKLARSLSPLFFHGAGGDSGEVGVIPVKTSSLRPDNIPAEIEDIRRLQIRRPPYPLPGHDPDLVAAEEVNAHRLFGSLLQMVRPEFLPYGLGTSAAQTLPISPAAPMLAPVLGSHGVQPPPTPPPTPTSNTL